jgi:hypothetical protein
MCGYVATTNSIQVRANSIQSGANSIQGGANSILEIKIEWVVYHIMFGYVATTNSIQGGATVYRVEQTVYRVEQTLLDTRCLKYCIGVKRLFRHLYDGKNKYLMKRKVKFSGKGSLNCEPEQI